MKNDKLKFTLIPVSGTLKSGGGFRAKFGTLRKEVLGLDDVVREAKDAGRLLGLDEEVAKVIVRGVLKTMVEKTAEDGKTRRIDDYLNISLKVRGRFESADEDFDPAKHTLGLSLCPLAALRPKFKLQPVNVNRKRQFRIYSITAADGSCEAGRVIWRKDIRIKGADLLQPSGKGYVSAQMKTPDGTSWSVDPEIVTATSTEIVCHWPSEFMDEFYKEGYMTLDVCKLTPSPDADTDFSSRGKTVYVRPGIA